MTPVLAPEGNSCTAHDAFSCDDFDLYGWIAPGIQDLAGVNVIDVLHDQAGVGSVLSDV